MKKILYSFFILTLILALAAPTTFADNNGKGQTKKVVKTNKYRVETQYHNDDDDQERVREEYEGIFSGLPHGLSKREILPYGLDKKEFLPFGLGKRIDGHYQNDASAIIGQASALVAEGNATLELFADSDLTDELQALSSAIALVESEITSLEAALAEYEKGDVVDVSGLSAASDALQSAISAFDTVYVDAASITALNTQVTSIEDMVSGQVYGEVQGAYPTDAAQALLDYIAVVNAAIVDPVTFDEFTDYSTSLDDLATEFLKTKYATAAEVATYDVDLQALKTELEAWFDTGLVADTDVSVYTVAVAEYKTLLDTTLLEELDALVAASELNATLNDIEAMRQALFPVVSE